MEAYCVKCQKKVIAKNIRIINLKRLGNVKEGECPVCGTKVYKAGY
jgi:hypothetical protein